MSVQSSHFFNILEEMGENPDREGLRDTPKRAAVAMKDLTSGYTMTLEEVVNGAVFDAEDTDELILVKDIEFYSLCEHHILPFHGSIHVGYIPNDKIIGLSKIPRICDMYAKRLQIQERITNEIAECLDEFLSPKGVGVVVEATHFCMSMRGIRKQNATMTTSALRGVFKETDGAARAEFFSLVNGR